MSKGLSSLVVFPLMLLAASPKMRIGYYGHAFFEVVLPSGVRVVMDPFDPNYVPNPIGLDFPTGVEADVVVITHTHFDHRYWQGIGGSPDVFISTSGSSNGIDITAHPTKHRLTGQEGENYIMTWEWGDIKFAHMGGYWDIFSAEDSTVLAGSDFIVFMLFTAGAGTPFIDKILPPVAFPNHYFTADHNPFYADVLITLEEVNESLDYPIEAFDDAWIAVDIDNLPDSTVIWEPAYSPKLPADVSINSLAISEGPPPYSMTASLRNNSTNPSDEAVITRIISDSSTFIYSDTGSVRGLDADEDFDFTFEPWTPPTPGEYSIYVEVICPADEVPPNDTLSLTAYLSGVTETRPTGSLRLDIRWLADDVLLIEYSGTEAELAIYDANGRRIEQIGTKAQPEGIISYSTDHLSKGVYFIQLSASQGSATRKLVLLH